MEAIIQKIVTREYDMMIRINNIGGPASCQSQTDAFSLMRTSQFQVWTNVMLESYLGDLIVVAPEDAHKPRCVAGAPCQVKKVVVKVAV